MTVPPMPIMKMVFGYMLLVLLAVLAATIALGKVEQNTSHGLDQILGGLLVISGAFAHWAFGEPDAKETLPAKERESGEGSS